MLKHKKAFLREIQSIVGLLNFACSLITPGRPFLRRLIDLTIGVCSPYQKIRLTKEVKADLAVWQSFLAEFNGKSFFLDDQWYNSEHLKLFTDSAGSCGFGAIFGSKWCYGAWPADWFSYNIAVLSFYPIVLSLCLWGHLMKNQCILFFTDNEAVMHAINKQSCKDKDMMFYVRKLVLICLENNILFKAKHIRGIHNVLADSLSRLQIAKFMQMAPDHMDKTKTDIPLHLQPQNWLQPSSIPTYSRAWWLFSTFFHTVFPGVSISLPFSPPTIALFISYLFERNYAVSTVSTYISALGYFHKLHGHADPSKNFPVIQMMKGYSKMDIQLDSRLPITLPILHRLVSSSSQLSCSSYNITLFQAMCLFAFHTFSRIGEITQTQSNHVNSKN